MTVTINVGKPKSGFVQLCHKDIIPLDGRRVSDIYRAVQICVAEPIALGNDLKIADMEAGDDIRAVALLRKILIGGVQPAFSQKFQTVIRRKAESAELVP